jgi:hypothetical protein
MVCTDRVGGSQWHVFIGASGGYLMTLCLAAQAQSTSGQAHQDPELHAADTEMRILEASIDKISELLAVAFGDAGVDIIAENMRCMGGLDPMVPGNRTVRLSPCPILAALHNVHVFQRAYSSDLQS